jgi:predicted GNAT family acetyltransferase
MFSAHPTNTARDPSAVGGRDRVVRVGRADRQRVERESRLSQQGRSRGTAMGLDVRREEAEHRGAFYIERDGARVAEMTYSRANDHLVIIDHTDVHDSLRGQGAGRQLLDSLVGWARESHTKVMATCPYALSQFRKDPSIRDVLV